MGWQVTRPPCALPIRLGGIPRVSVSWTNRSGHPYIARMRLLLPCCLPWFWKSDDSANLFRLGNPHHRREVARLNCHRDTVEQRSPRAVYSRKLPRQLTRGN